MVKVNADNLKTGDVMSECTYYKVEKDVQPGDKEVDVVDQDEKKMSISISIVNEGNFHSADQFGSIENVNKTEIAEKMLQVGDSVFTVHFHKQPSEADVVAAAEEPDVKTRKAKVRAAMKGEHRTLRGHLGPGGVKSGRISVIDMDADKGNNLRQVDLRTIEFLISKGVKYVCGKVKK